MEKSGNYIYGKKYDEPLFKKNMTIWNSLRKRWKEDVVIKSIVWTSIIEIFKTEKNIDLTTYLVSINIRWFSIIITTNKPIINAELLLLNDKILEKTKDRIKKIGLIFRNMEIKYK